MLREIEKKLKSGEKEVISGSWNISTFPVSLWARAEQPKQSLPDLPSSLIVMHSKAIATLLLVARGVP